MSAAARNASAARQGVRNAHDERGGHGGPETQAPAAKDAPEYQYLDPPKACQSCFYVTFSKKVFDFTYGDPFQNFILGVICVAGLLVGIQTYDGMEDEPVLVALDMVILGIFIFELILKILSEGLRPWRVFVGEKWAWNWFDLIVVVLCLPGPPQELTGGNVAALRLARLARLFKIVDKIPQLKLIINGLFGGMRAIMYITLLLLMVFYFYAILGMTVFMENDPWHFGNFGLSMVTLFRMATLEDWTEIMYLNFFGCNVYSAAIYANRTCNATQYIRAKDLENGIEIMKNFKETDRPYEAGCTNMDAAVCDNPQAQEVVTILYMVTFVVVSSLVLLSMFIGAVTLAMTESLAELQTTSRDLKRQKVEEDRKERVSKQCGMSNADLIRDMTRDELLRHKRIRKVLKSVWDGDDVDADFDNVSVDHYPAELDTAWKRCYDRIAQVANKIVFCPPFQLGITITIVVASILVGLQTEPSIQENTAAMDFFGAMDYIIGIIFIAEVVLKIVGCSIHPLRFFHDSWNNFDFVVVVASLLNPQLLLVRVIRLLRVLKMVRTIPELRMHVSALVSGLSSITYIGLIMFLAFYIMGILGIILFGTNDPWHFGNIHLAMVTLFRCATMEDWTDVMYINMFGCDQYGYDGTAWNGRPSRAECEHPRAYGYLSVLYFVTFILIASLVLLNLFIGVITSSMEATKKEMEAEASIEANVVALQQENNLKNAKLSVYREVFEMLDTDESGSLDRKEVQMGLKAVDKMPTDEELDFLFNQLDADESGEIAYTEFIKFMIEAESSNLQQMMQSKAGGGNPQSEGRDLAARSKATQNKRVKV